MLESNHVNDSLPANQQLTQAVNRTTPRLPWGFKWRSSVWFVTSVVTLGVTTDLLVYSMLIPVFPFQLQKLGYTRVSGLVGWLLFAYSGGLIGATPPVAIISERYMNRQHPLLLGQLVLIGSQILLMEAPKYWVMILARIIQGISSAVIWVVGLALLCDTVPESRIATQLGIAMSGVSLGFLVGPPVGGALYSAFGYRAPFIFGIIVTFIDFVGRLLIIERMDAALYQLAISDIQTEGAVRAVEVTTENEDLATTGAVTNAPVADLSGNSESSPQEQVSKTATGPASARPSSVRSPITVIGVLRLLMRSPRALMAMFNAMAFGTIYTMQEPTLAVHLQDVWNLSSGKVGVVYIASVVPALISGPFTGWWTDKWGPEWITVICVILFIPWIVTTIIEKSLSLFVTAYALQSLFLSGIIAPLTAELAAVARGHEGLGYGHVYGAFNFFYGAGSALGPIIGGQLYDHIHRGWMAICLVSVGIAALCVLLSIIYVGDKPLVRRMFERQDTSEIEMS
ncbi:MFS general substrate transporter [Cristinia sonorae]|uniref:MFS general substrate transporter n=1 Tax=Cristinia sonorae TaxID=1940300 RepID=A0A8K0UGY9_9AGAR|nr:MFS general substrate transporter [Cristinia sonorae]